MVLPSQRWTSDIGRYVKDPRDLMQRRKSEIITSKKNIGECNRSKGYKSPRFNNPHTSVSKEIVLELVDTLVFTLQSFLESGGQQMEPHYIKKEAKKQN